MVVFYLLIFALALYGVSFNNNGFNDGYRDRMACNASVFVCNSQFVWNDWYCVFL